MKKKSPLSAFLSMLLSSMLLVTFCSAVPAHAAASWDIQIVDENGARSGYGRVCPIVLDSNNNPHMLYISPYSDCNVTYASSNGSAWSTQAIALGMAFSLVLDVNDTPHILRSGLTYASWTGTNWTSQIVDPTVGNGFATLVLDSLGNPHVAYVNDHGTMVKYAYWTGTNWTIQTVDTYGEIPLELSLALDSNNTPYILYDFTLSIPTGTGNYRHLEEVKLATWRNSNWSIQTIAYTGGFGNMVLDSKGYPHIIYEIDTPNFTGFSNGSLVYASWNGYAWDNQTVVSNADLVNVGARTSAFLALDSHDYPHIIYVASSYNPERGDVNSLKYASWTGTAWNIQTVDKENYTAFGPCYLALDSNDNPHISFTGAPPPPSHIYYRSAYIMYATANATELTQPSPEPFPIVPVAAITVVVVTVVSAGLLVYFKKRHH